VSRTTRDELERRFPDYVPNLEIGITPIDLERIYHMYETKVSGPCEMRQKWYPSILNPRTYYAMGGDAYHSSKYLAKAFVDLCDKLPATNRRTRVEPSRVTIRDETNDVAFYDLTSFTSNLHPQCAFMYRLANYARGVRVYLVDAVRGIISEDLGYLIYEYTKHNLDNPSYTIPSKYGDPSVNHYHSIAGFLGVYGNIATATFLHGAVMAMRHEYTDENNVAGDDGLDITPSVDNTLNTVQLLGQVKDEKTFRMSEGCCIHLKRPITRIGNRLLQGQLYTWPSLEAGQNDTDPRYTQYNDLSNRDRRSIAASSITAFLRKLESQHIDTSELELVDTFMIMMYDTYKLPKAGCVPQALHDSSSFVPIYEKRFIGLDPIRNTIIRNYTGIARLPLRGKQEWQYEMFQDGTFRCNNTKLLSYLVKLGYVEQVKIQTLSFGNAGLDQLIREYVDPDPLIYDYTIMRKLPTWITDFSF
jgi:hypothetical protein